MTGTKLFSRLIIAALALALALTLLPVAARAATVSGVVYLDENGAPQTAVSATVVTATDTGWSTGWYVVTGNVTIPDTVTVNGDVHLILTDGCSLTVNADDLSNDAGILVQGAGNSLAVYGQAQGTGTLTANGAPSGAGIGGNFNGSGESVVTINGGTVFAGGGYCTGIGGGNASDGGNGGSATVTINGGTVTANGGLLCTGIGGGRGGGNTGGGTGGSATVTINGGTVTATGGIDSAGIGGGKGGDPRNDIGSNTGGGTGGSAIVTINGGTVTATGGINSAGIGGGRGGNYLGSSNTGGGTGGSAMVTISSGTVTATGGKNGVGIGGGRCGNYIGSSGSGTGGNATVDISNGTVTATGGENGVGIGGGIGGDGGGTNGSDGSSDVTITGGSVKTAGIGGTPKNGSDAPVYLTTVTLDGAGDGVEVPALTLLLNNAAYPYGTKDMKTRDGGRLYLYLPEDIITKRASAGGRAYAGEVLTSTDAASSQGTLTRVYTNDSPGYLHQTLQDPATGVSLTGYFEPGARLTVTPKALHAEGTCAACDAIRREQKAGNMLALYDISASPAPYGAVELSFPVGTKYNGQTLAVLHCNNGVLEEKALTVQNGMATGSFVSLSPFAALKTGRAGLLSIPKTGDNGGTGLWLALIGAALALAGLAIWRLGKKRGTARG